MKKVLKGLQIALVIMLISITLFSPNTRVQAKTLRQLKEELAAKEAELASGQEQKKFTEQEIQAKRDSINAINSEIEIKQKKKK